MSTYYCKNCGLVFGLSESDRQFYKDNNYDEPKKCPKCRALKAKKEFKNKSEFIDEKFIHSDDTESFSAKINTNKNHIDSILSITDDDITVAEINEFVRLSKLTEFVSINTSEAHGKQDFQAFLKNVNSVFLFGIVPKGSNDLKRVTKMAYSLKNTELYKQFNYSDDTKLKEQVWIIYDEDKRPFIFTFGEDVSRLLLVIFNNLITSQMKSTIVGMDNNELIEFSKEFSRTKKLLFKTPNGNIKVTNIKEYSMIGMLLLDEFINRNIKYNRAKLNTNIMKTIPNFE